MPKSYKHSFLYYKCWALLVHYACFMLQFVRFFHAQASQTRILVLQMLGILDSFFGMYIFLLLHQGSMVFNFPSYTFHLFVYGFS